MKTKYGVTNQLAQLTKAPSQSQYGAKRSATGLSKIEQMGAAQDFSFMPKKKSKPVMGERMMFKGGGMVTAKPN